MSTQPFWFRTLQKDLSIIKWKTGQYTCEAPVIDRKYNTMKQKNPLKYAIKKEKSWNAICSVKQFPKKLFARATFALVG